MALTLGLTSASRSLQQSVLYRKGSKKIKAYLIVYMALNIDP